MVATSLVVCGIPAAVANTSQARSGRHVGVTPAGSRALQGHVTVVGAFGPGKADTAHAAPDGLTVKLLSVTGQVMGTAETRNGN